MRNESVRPPAAYAGESVDRAVARERSRRLHPIAIALLGAASAAESASAQPCFVQRVITTQQESSDIQPADVDGDGDNDLFVSLLGGDTIGWHENNGSANPAFTFHVITSLADGAADVLAIDFDHDGDLDVISASRFGDTVDWHENDGAPDPTFITRTITTTAVSVISVWAADLDGDGDTDVLSASPGDSTIAWYENDGAAVPGFTARVISSLASSVFTVRAADVDGDGDTDVISASAYPTDVVAWFENDGAVDPVFIERLITADAFFVGKIDVADVDGDGDADVLLPSSGDSTLAWYENDGAADPTFTPNVIVSESVEHASLTDMDGDGDLDVLAVYTFVDSGSSFKKNVWFEHDGATDPSFTERFITSVPVAIPVQAPVAASSADMDGDGDMDLLSVGTYTIAWDEQGSVENLDTGAVFDHLGEAIPAASPGDTLLAGSAAFCGQCQPDLDFQDKAIEIIAGGSIERNVQTTTTLADGATLSAISGSSVGVRGLLNVPAGATGTIIGDAVTIGGPVNIGASGVLVAGPSVLFEGSVEFSDGLVVGSHPKPRTVIAADLDADGDIDVLSANSDDDTVVWYENDGAPDPVLTEHVVTSVADSAFSVTVSDVDGDGDLDVLSASTRDDKIAWHENNGATLPSFTEHIVSTTVDFAIAVLGADIDNDGDTDILSASSTTGTIAWHENDGAPAPSFTERVITASQVGLFGMHAEDMDGDGDIDVLSAAAGTDAIVWYENDGAPVPSFTAWVVDPLADGGWEVYAADVDSDGDMDILSAASNIDTIAWYENNGAVDPAFTRRVISAQEERCRSVYAADVDGDGDTDVLSASFNDDLIAWHENDGSAVPVFTRHVITTLADQAESVFAADIDGDGDTDVLSGSTRDSKVAWYENILVSDLGLSAPKVTFESTGSLALVNKSISVGPSSTLQAGTTLTADRSSTLTGSGSIRASQIDTAGVTAPDAGQTLTLDGDYSQLFDDGVTGLRSGEMRIDLGSGTPSALNVSGSIGLAGSLTVTADPGFDPQEGTVFGIISTGVPVGAERFDAAFLPGLPGGKYLRVAYDIEVPGGSQEGAGGSVSLVVAALGEDLGLGAPDDLSVAGIPNAAALADMNADGLPDVVLVAPDDVSPQGAPGSVLVLLNGGDAAGVWQGFTGGVIQTPTGVDPSSVAVGQLDNVTGPDAAVANREDGTVRLLLNDGAGTLTTFADIAFNERPAAVVIGDLDEDGFNDVAAAGSDVEAKGRLSVRLNAGTEGVEWTGLASTQSDFEIGDAPTFMDIGDLDNDSCLDIFIGTRGDQGVNMMNNLAGGQGANWGGFDPPLVILTGQFPAAGDIGDLDNDSCLDLLITDINTDTLSLILHNGGPGVFSFQPPASLPAGQNPRSVVSSDLDGDGDGDIAMVTDSDDGSGRVVRLLRNDLDPATGQLQFAPASLVETVGEPLFVLTADVDGLGGEDLVAITEGSGEIEEGGGQQGGVSTALNLEGLSPGCSPADLAEPFGLLDLADVLAFASAFASLEPAADFDGNGLFDLADVLGFVSVFNVGCH